MTLTSSRYRWNSRLGRVENNSPVMRSGEQGQAVRLVQQTLIDLGYPMPTTVRKYGSPDGIYGSETTAQIRSYQGDNSLSSDGKVGKNTITALDGDCSANGFSGILPALPARARYMVPGISVTYDQLQRGHTNLCWAYSYTMLYSWKHRECNDAEQVVTALGDPWKRMFDNNRTIGSGQVGNFARAGGLQLGPLQCLTSAGWVELLRAHGLIWIWQLNGGASMGHIRVLAGVSGDGNDSSTRMYILDPWQGRRYYETFEQFTRRYEETAHSSFASQMLYW